MSKNDDVGALIVGALVIGGAIAYGASKRQKAKQEETPKPKQSYSAPPVAAQATQTSASEDGCQYHPHCKDCGACGYWDYCPTCG